MSRIGQWVTGSDPKKYGKLFSDVMLKAWPKPPARGQQAGEKELLRHVLRWTPFVNFFTIVGKTQYSCCFVYLSVCLFVILLFYVCLCCLLLSSCYCMSLICNPNITQLVSNFSHVYAKDLNQINCAKKKTKCYTNQFSFNFETV